MKKEDFDAFLMNAIEDDKRNIGCDEQNFDVMYNRLRKHQKIVDSQKKMINYGVLPVLMMVVALNIYLLFNQNNETPKFVEDVFAEETLINSSANYFSEVLLSVNE